MSKGSKKIKLHKRPKGYIRDTNAVGKATESIAEDAFRELIKDGIIVRFKRKDSSNQDYFLKFADYTDFPVQIKSSNGYAVPYILKHPNVFVLIIKNQYEKPAGRYRQILAQQAKEDLLEEIKTRFDGKPCLLPENIAALRAQTAAQIFNKVKDAKLLKKLKYDPPAEKLIAVSLSGKNQLDALEEFIRERKTERKNITRKEI